MARDPLRNKVERYLHHLCLEIPNRRLGAPGNRQATEWVGGLFAQSGFEIEVQEFTCLDWIGAEAGLEVQGRQFPVRVSPYSNGGSFQGPLAVASSLDELEAGDLAGSILLLKGDLTQEQLIPKRFPFFTLESHQRVYSLLEEKAPAAIIAATGRNPELAGGMYPFPLFEDGDFDIPSAYMKDVDGEVLSEQEGQEIHLEIRSERIPSTGRNVIAKRDGKSGRRIVVMAHIDAKDGSPGALDNGAGVVVLLLLAELLGKYRGKHTLELVAINGEDHYSARGQVRFVAANKARFKEILLGVNIDGAGYAEGRGAYSLYEVPPMTQDQIRSVFSRYPLLAEGDPWYQGDHSILIQNGVPALAITTDRFLELSTEITHTPDDRPELVDNAQLVEISIALRDCILELSGRSP